MEGRHEDDLGGPHPRAEAQRDDSTGRRPGDEVERVGDADPEVGFQPREHVRGEQRLGAAAAER
jgi:hypothetical protein